MPHVLFAADGFRICVMSIFLSVYIHINVCLWFFPSPDDFFSRAVQHNKTIFSLGEKWAEKKENVFRSIRYCGVPWKTQKEREKIGDFFLLLKLRKDEHRHFPFFLHLERMKRKLWKKFSSKLKNLFKKCLLMDICAKNRSICYNWNELSAKWVVLWVWKEFFGVLKGCDFYYVMKIDGIAKAS